MTQNKIEIAAVIPAYHPESLLPDLAEQLALSGEFSEVVVVDDGNGSEYAAIFAECQTRNPKIQVLTHVENRGKGAGLKTAFRYLLESSPERCAGAVTLDADGQHTLADTLKLCQKWRAEPQRFYLGVRDFHHGHGIPLRSRFGNLVTEFFFALCTGGRVTDTQTGLRVYPVPFMRLSLALPTDRYEFELDALLAAVEHKISFGETAISIVYENGNACSSFHPIRDSYRIYKALLRYFFRTRIGRRPHCPALPSEKR